MAKNQNMALFGTLGAVQVRYKTRVVKVFPLITKAVVIGPAAKDTFAFSENIMLAVYTEPEGVISKVCVDLNRAFGDNDIFNVDIYMMADEDFYTEVHGLIDDGEVIFAR